MNVASLELCKELYEQSGWNDTEYDYCRNKGDEWDVWDQTAQGEYSYPGFERSVAAYDLGYLLRKLPDWLDWHLSPNPEVGYWMSSNNVEDNVPRVDAATPEDAAAKLAIELFKQGILHKEVV
jgi:hypothetical protein